MTRSIHGIAAIALLALVAGSTPDAHAQGDNVTPVRSEKLPNVPGKSVTTVLVNYAPGGKSVSHHHAGSVMAYVLTGQIRSENSATGPAKVYKAGEAFFEPPGAKSSRSRRSLCSRRALASSAVIRTCVTRPVRGSANGNAMFSTYGKVCSHTGS